MLWWAEALASRSASPVRGRGFEVNQVSCTSTFERYGIYVLRGFFGKTSRERSQAKVGRLSDSSCPKWTNSGTVWHGGYSMRSSSEYPSAAAVSFLSDILETHAPAKYSLSQKACEGIIRRAEKRGKPLPPQLDEALRAQASNSTKEQEPGATSPTCAGRCAQETTRESEVNLSQKEKW